MCWVGMYLAQCRWYLSLNMIACKCGGTILQVFCFVLLVIWRQACMFEMMRVRRSDDHMIITVVCGGIIQCVRLWAGGIYCHWIGSCPWTDGHHVTYCIINMQHFTITLVVTSHKTSAFSLFGAGCTFALHVRVLVCLHTHEISWMQRTQM